MVVIVSDFGVAICLRCAALAMALELVPEIVFGAAEKLRCGDSAQVSTNLINEP